MLRTAILTSLLALGCFCHAAEEPNRLRITAGVRYNTILDRDTLDQATSWFQYRTRANYSVGLATGEAGAWTLRGLAGTGPLYTTSWNSFYSTIGQPVPSQSFNMRLIYLQDDYAGWTGQIGVIPPFHGDITDLGYDVDGWVRGGRLVAPVLEGNLQLVSGAIDRLSNPNAFQFWQEWNYFGSKIQQALPYSLSGFLSYEYLENDNYLGAQLQRTWALNENMSLATKAEALYNTNEGVPALGISTSLNTRPIRANLQYTYINDNFGLRGALSDDFFGFNHRLSLNFSGDVGLRGLRWFFQTDVKEQILRFRIGFNFTFDRTTPGYLLGSP